jgi:hypothetical protein
VTTDTVEGGATPAMSTGFEGVDGLEGVVGVDGVPDTGGAELVELPPPLHAASNPVNKIKLRPR